MIGAMSGESPDDLHEILTELGTRLRATRMRLVLAESCTGGGIAHAVTCMAGCSDWFDRAYVTYSDKAKSDMLGVESKTIVRFGAVSEETVIEMARKALDRSGTDLAIAVSGIAGPGGGAPDKPVGTVCFAWAGREGESRAETVHFDGNRAEVRAASVKHALRGLLAML